jgi:hypothetical protein
MISCDESRQVAMVVKGCDESKQAEMGREKL